MPKRKPEQNARPSVLTVLGDGALLLCAMCGLTSSFLSLYGNAALAQTSILRASPLDLCAARAGDLLPLAAVFALVSLGLWSLPRFWGLAAGGAAALWGLAAFFYQRPAGQGAGLTLHIVTKIFSSRVSWGRVFEYDPGLSTRQGGQAVWLFLLLALAGLALALGWAIVRARRWWIAAILTLPPLMPGLLADLYPNWTGFMALCLCFCAMLLTDLCKWAAPDRRGALTLVMLPCAAAVLALITLAFPREGYTRPSWALEAETQLQTASTRASDFFAQFNGPFQRTVTYVGAAEQANLARAGALRYSGRTVLRVSSDCGGRLYLRGSSLAEYQDGVWRAMPEGTYEEYCPSGEKAPVPLYFPALLGTGGETHTVTVENIGAVGACVYAPYFPVPQDPDDTGALPVEDAYFARRQGQWTHTMSFVDREPLADFGFAGPGSWQEAAGEYTRYAYEHYLDVPRGLRDTLDQMIDQALHRPVELTPEGAAYYQLECAQRVAAWLESRCEYDPEASPAPEGTDPVEYFLAQSRRGYCMHFASAAALMLREIGVPARYVSGFTAESIPGRQVAVPDRAAHAWIEVWIDGFGWYPVEVTPPAAFTWYVQGTDLPEDEPLPTEEGKETPEPDETPSLDPEAPSEAPSAALPVQEDAPGGEQAGADLTPLFTALKVLGAVLGAFALLWLAQWLPKRVRARRLRGPDPNRAALTGYGYLLRMKRWGGRVDEQALELAQKARFSWEGLTQEERERLCLLVSQERERLCVVLDPLPRLLFRYFWGMPRPAELQPRPEPPEKP